MKRVIFNTCKKENKTPVTSSRVEIDEGLELMIDNIKSDFDYILDGLDKLGRSGANSSNDAKAIAETLSASLSSTIKQIAGKVVE